MSTYDNGPQLADWRLPPRCCGDWVRGLVCPLCSEYVSPPPNAELGTN